MQEASIPGQAEYDRGNDWINQVAAEVAIINGGGGGGTVTTLSGSGSPEGVVTGSPGWTYTDVTNNAFYTKVTGTATNTGWQIWVSA